MTVMRDAMGDVILTREMILDILSSLRGRGIDCYAEKIYGNGMNLVVDWKGVRNENLLWDALKVVDCGVLVSFMDYDGKDEVTYRVDF